MSRNTSSKQNLTDCGSLLEKNENIMTKRLIKFKKIKTEKQNIQQRKPLSCIENIAIQTKHKGPNSTLRGTFFDNIENDQIKTERVEVLSLTEEVEIEDEEYARRIYRYYIKLEVNFEFYFNISGETKIDDYERKILIDCDLMIFCQYAYTTSEIKDMEFNILLVLDYNLSLPIALYFSKRLAKMCKISQTCQVMAEYFMETSLTDSNLSKYYPSLNAAACVYLAMTVLKDVDNTEKLEKCSNYKFVQLMPFMKNIPK
ncbi:hypothetical protein HZS_6083, partial [Henneguya salminicola]